MNLDNKQNGHYEPKEYFLIEEVARKLNLEEDQVIGLIKKEKLKAIKSEAPPSPYSYIISVKDFNNFYNKYKSKK
jgi:hypothetical protein